MAGGMRNTEQPADQGECNVTRRELEQIAGMERIEGMLNRVVTGMHRVPLYRNPPWGS
jgi:hypothetical protein